MGSLFLAGKSSKRKISNMNMKMYILAVFVAAFLAGAEAGCDANGCCYCNSAQGYVVNKGVYKTDCDDGYFCACNHHPRIDKFYGQCSQTAPLAAPSAPRRF